MPLLLYQQEPLFGFWLRVQLPVLWVHLPLFELELQPALAVSEQDLKHMSAGGNRQVSAPLGLQPKPVRVVKPHLVLLRQLPIHLVLSSTLPWKALALSDSIQLWLLPHPLGT